MEDTSARTQDHFANQHSSGGPASGQVGKPPMHPVRPSQYDPVSVKVSKVKKAEKDPMTVSRLKHQVDKARKYIDQLDEKVEYL